jgi:hypothetical protein
MFIPQTEINPTIMAGIKPENKPGGPSSDPIKSKGWKGFIGKYFVSFPII